MFLSVLFDIGFSVFIPEFMKLAYLRSFIGRGVLTADPFVVPRVCDITCFLLSFFTLSSPVHADTEEH
jgi:hypothetical protein